MNRFWALPHRRISKHAIRSRMGLSCFFILVMTAVFGVPAGLAAAQVEPVRKAVLILDGSGSMGGKIDGTPKIEIARDVVGDLLDDWEQDVQLGLVTYGHRERGNCEDIETLIPVGPLDSARFKTAVDAVLPTGKTPITAAVTKAAQGLGYEDAPATVILISDGLETCNADPCSAASDLEKRGVDFTVHVVGFDISDENVDSLKCIAENTGGKFFTAGNATELKGALTQTRQIVEQNESLTITVAEPEQVANGPQGLKLAASLAEGGELLDSNLFFWVYEAKKNIEGNREQISSSSDDEPLFELPAGRYYVRVRHGDAYADTELEVAPDTLTRHVINLNAGYLRLAAMATEGADLLDNNLFYWVYEAKKDIEGNRKQITSSGDAEPLFRVSAGQYFVRVRHGDAYASAEVEITAGELTEQTIDLNSGYLRLAAVPTEGAEPLGDNLFYWVYEAKKDLEGNRKQISSGGDAEPLFRLPAGRYYVRVRFGDAYAGTELEIVAGELTEQTIDLNAGYLRLAAALTEGAEPLGDNLFYWVYEAQQDVEGNRKQVTSTSDAKPLFRLPAGRYSVRVRHGDDYVDAELEVEADTLTEHTIALSAG